MLVPNADGFYVLSSGETAVLQPNDDAFRKEIFGCFPSKILVCGDGRIRSTLLCCSCNELWAEPLWDYIQWHDESSLFQYAANVWQAMKDTAGSYTSLSLKLAKEIIGTIAQEVVLKAKHRDSGSRYLGKVDASQIGEFHVTGSSASYYSAIQRLHSENRWQ
ncbi:hypothetical protein GH714_028536 [Hevea brasiliensis]|uniref:Uncharacterized protein n=1 Tax=Hevea brasiliensis TaxID=3981 RepID=A0A6A6LRX2_HEVBR|nr:hypothetical protein GH714_028536 [Hevea brasiliensis]